MQLQVWYKIKKKKKKPLNSWIPLSLSLTRSLTFSLTLSHSLFLTPKPLPPSTPLYHRSSLPCRCRRSLGLHYRRCQSHLVAPSLPTILQASLAALPWVSLSLSLSLRPSQSHSKHSLQVSISLKTLSQST